MKKRSLSILAILVSLFLAGPLHAACFAEYKAKQDNPLRFHFGVIELPQTACGSRQKARNEISQRLSRAGWVLLSIGPVFGEDGLNNREPKDGEYFLRF